MKAIVCFLLMSTALCWAASDLLDDEQLERDFVRRTAALFQQGHTASLATLQRQLSRTNCQVRLDRPPTAKLTPAEIFQKRRAGVVAVAAVRVEADRDPTTYAVVTGFILTRSGVMVTHYKAIEVADMTTVGVRTADGQCHGVKEVLAADPAHDIIVLQLEGDDFTPVPLAPNAPIGSPVTVISHAGRRYYSLTTGVISRYMLQPGTKIGWVAMTADIAIGSAGGPVFNEAGAVVAMANMTQSIDVSANGKPAFPQMVVKVCAPSESILALFPR